MGDVLMTTPALVALRTHFKDATIDCVTNNIGKEVLQNQGLVNNILLESDSNKNRYDISILFKATLRNSIKSKMLRIPTRIGWRREGNHFFLTHPIKTESEHRIHQNIDLLKSLGITNTSDQMEYQVSTAAPTPDFGRYIVLNPGASTPSNRWPSEYFAKLTNLIHSNLPHAVVLTGNVSDKIIADKIIENIRLKDRVFNYCGESTIDTLAKVLQGASAIITGDTGPLHLAIAVKTPNVIAIFGPANEKLTGPLPKYGIVLAKDRNGDWRNGNPKFENIPVSDIKPEEVFKRLDSILK